MNERCFALRKSGECGALMVNGCPGHEQCAFYKPIWKFKKDLNTANMRLRLLPENEQLRIAEKYYKGRLPKMRDGV